MSRIVDVFYAISSLTARWRHSNDARVLNAIGIDRQRSHTLILTVCYGSQTLCGIMILDSVGVTSQTAFSFKLRYVPIFAKSSSFL